MESNRPTMVGYEESPGDDHEHVAMLMWAASVMAREIELCAGHEDDLDQATVDFIVAHLRSASTDFHKLVGLNAA